MVSIAALLPLMAVAAAASFSSQLQEEEWAAFKLEHKKQYSAAEDKLRKQIFAESKLLVAQHNQRFERGLVSFSLKINQFADLLHSEYIPSGYNVLNRTAEGQKGRGATFIPPPHLVTPKRVDWRNKGAVTAVKDQGECDASWAFSATGALEGQIFRATKTLKSLSEQNLIDCSVGYGNEGCGSGQMTSSFEYVRDNDGIDTEENYPYEAKQKTCRYTPQAAAGDDAGYVEVERGDEASLAAAVAVVGPAAVAVDATHASFHMYADGIYYEESCRETNINHCMLVVGYGTDEQGGDYWLVKNSMGSSWGKAGYIRMARNRENNCGVASFASYPLLAAQTGPRPWPRHWRD